METYNNMIIRSNDLAPPLQFLKPTHAMTGIVNNPI